MRALALLVIAACGGGAATVAAPATVAQPAGSAFTARNKLETTTEEVGFLTPDGSNVPGTIVRPNRPGKFPAIVLFAGSGPTDRDWNTPLIKTKNGSGKLLAEALAAHGAVVLRFDKAQVGQNLVKLEGQTIAIYVDETRAALAYLRSRGEVDGSRLFLAGHSEGGIHVLRTAAAEGKHIAGVLFLSASSRSMRDIVIAQITAQVASAPPEQASAILGPFTKALDDFMAGATVDPKKATPIPQLQQLIAAFVAPASAGVARGLLSFDPKPMLAQVRVPIFVFNGQRDLQVDPELDAKVLAAEAKKTNADVTLFIAPDADHVLKHQTATLDELRKDPEGTEVGYNAPDRVLDPAALDAIVSWLAKH